MGPRMGPGPPGRAGGTGRLPACCFSLPPSLPFLLSPRRAGGRGAPGSQFKGAGSIDQARRKEPALDSPSSSHPHAPFFSPLQHVTFFHSRGTPESQGFAEKSPHRGSEPGRGGRGARGAGRTSSSPPPRELRGLFLPNLAFFFLFLRQLEEADTEKPTCGTFYSIRCLLRFTDTKHLKQLGAGLFLRRAVFSTLWEKRDYFLI